MFIKVNDRYKKELRINVDNIMYYLPAATSGTEINLKGKIYLTVLESVEEIDKMIELAQINKQDSVSLKK